MGRPKDQFWEYVNVFDGGLLSCKFCKKEFYGGCSRVKSHLSGIRGRDVATCPEVPRDVKEAAIRAIGVSEKKTKSVAVMDTIEWKESTSSSSSTDIFARMDMVEVNELLVKHLIMNNVPLDVIKEPYFLNLLTGVAKLGPRYKPPSYSTLLCESLPSFENEVKRNLRTVQKSWSVTGCTLILDSEVGGAISSPRCKLLLNVYSPKGLVSLEAPVVHSQSDTRNWKDLAMEIMDHESLSIDNVVQVIVCDSSANKGIEYVDMNAVAQIIADKCPWICLTRCVQREIEILLCELFCTSKWLSDLIDDANSLYKLLTRYHYSEKWCKCLRAEQMEQQSSGVHADSFAHLRSLLEIETELQKEMLNDPELRRNILKIIKNNEFWADGKSVVHAFGPLFQILHFLDGLVPTLGYVYEAMEKAGRRIRYHHERNPNFEDIWDLFEKRRNELIIYPIHAAAAFLNPGFMLSNEFKENHEIIKGKVYMLERLVSAEEKKIFDVQLQVYGKKDPVLFTESAVSMLKLCHPVIWWDKFGDTLPVLKKYAIKLLSQPCSSLSSIRHKNQVERQDMIKYLLRMNVVMMEEFNRLGEGILQPLDLDKLDESFEFC